MILFDSSVIIDARDRDSPWHEWAQRQIALAISSEGAPINPIILAEMCVRSLTPEQAPQSLEQMGIKILDLPSLAGVIAGKAFAIYLQRRKAQGQNAPKVPLPDFFIGAHAQIADLKLATRDSERITTYFPSVHLIVPISPK